MSFSSRLREELVWPAADTVFVALAVLLAPVAVALWALELLRSKTLLYARGA